MRKLFISYSHKDSEFTQQLAEDLAREEVVVWIDTTKIKVSDSFIKQISIGLCQHDYFVPILSPTYVESDWCEKELNIGTKLDIEKKSSVLPILLKNCSIPVLISDKLYADFRTSYSQGYSALLAAIRNAKLSTRSKHAQNDLVISDLQYDHLGSDLIMSETTDGFDNEWEKITITKKNNELYQDFFIEFDVTSYASSDLRITGIDIVVVNSSPLAPITQVNGLCGISTARIFFGHFKKAPGMYPLKFNVPHSYVTLSQLEMEVIHLTINTPDEGIYDLKIVLNYSVGGKSGSISTKTIKDLWFVDADTYNLAHKKNSGKWYGYKGGVE